MKITDLITLNENDDFHSYFKNLQKTDPRFKNLRIHGDPEHDELRRQDAEARAKRLATPPAPPAVPSPEEIDQAKEKLLNLERKFDPNYEYSDDYTVWSRNNELAKQIKSLKQFIARGDQGVAEAATDDPKFQKMMGNIQKTTPDPFSGYVAVSYAGEKPSKKIKGATVNGKPVPTTTDDPGQLINDLKFTSDRIEQQLMAIGKKHGWDLIDPGQGQGYSELYFDTNREYTTNTQRQLATNIVKTVNEINKFFASMNSSLQATGLPGYRVSVWQGMGANGNTNQFDDINQITNIAKGKSAKEDPGPAIGKMILKYLPGYEAENDELGYDPKDFVDAKQVANIYITKGERAGLQAQHKLDSHVSEMIDELLSDHNGNSLRTIWDLDEQGVAEGHPDEKEDKALIRKMVKQQALKKENMLAREQHEDHEISMATSELKNVYINAKKLFDIIKQRSEQEGLDAWQQSKITKASDYLNSVLTAIRGEPRR
jgi:hypothetical protein